MLDSTYLALLPDPVDMREANIMALVSSYHELWEDLNTTFGGGEGLFRSAVEDPEGFCKRYVAWVTKPVPAGQGLAGCGSPFRGTEGRFFLSIWATHQTHGGDWAPFNKALKGCRLRRYQRLAVFVQRRLAAFGEVDKMGWSWPECRRSIQKGIEGSYRARAGYMFERAARNACMRVLQSSHHPWVLARNEVCIEGQDGEARLDIVAEMGQHRVVLACKSSCIDSSNHAALYERDVCDSLRRTGIHYDNAALILGGPGWEGVAQTTQLRTVHAPNITLSEEDLTDLLTVEIARLGLFDVA